MRIAVVLLVVFALSLILLDIRLLQPVADEPLGCPFNRHLTADSHSPLLVREEDYERGTYPVGRPFVVVKSC